VRGTISERAKKFKSELEALIQRGALLKIAIQYECDRKAFKEQISRKFDGAKDKIDEYIKTIPDFRTEYQAWYSEAQAVVKQVMPDRLADFISYFEIPKGRKEITFQNYMIRDYLQGLLLTRGYHKEVVVDGSAAIPEFTQQLNIVKAAKDTLESSLMDLKAVLQADLFDSEIESARALAKAGYLRATGAVCGVVLEKHLHHVCGIHNIKVTKKNPGISELIQLLKDAMVITVAQWRFIQSLADTRNLCDHAKGREPTKEEIADLLDGTEKTLKTVF
jgi:hypothetical protein